MNASRVRVSISLSPPKVASRFSTASSTAEYDRVSPASAPSPACPSAEIPPVRRLIGRRAGGMDGKGLRDFGGEGGVGRGGGGYYCLFFFCFFLKFCPFLVWNGAMSILWWGDEMGPIVSTCMQFDAPGIWDWRASHSLLFSFLLFLALKFFLGGGRGGR
jgi:hypothetical protein